VRNGEKNCDALTKTRPIRYPRVLFIVM